MEFYLDSTATTKPHKDVIDRMSDAMKNLYANPASMHSMGLKVENEVNKARNTISDFLNVNENEIYFTSGGTESNNLAILNNINLKRKKILSTRIEHASVLNPIKILAEKGIKVEYIPVDENGFIIIEEFEKLIDENVGFISIIHINNEFGSIQDIKKIVEITKKMYPHIVIHIDGVQSFGKIKTDLKYLGVDMYSASGHKINGPKGIGILYVKNGLNIKPIMYGGGQEKGIRSGTENVYGILGLEEAVIIRKKELENELTSVRLIKENFIKKLMKISGTKIIAGIDNVSPYILSVAFKNIKSEILLHYLEQEKIYISTGSACSKGKISSAIESINLDKEYIDGIIRISISPELTKDDIDVIVEKIKKSVLSIRNIMGE